MVEIEYELDRGYFTIPVLVEVAYVEPEPSVGIWGGWEIGQTIITEDVYDEETGTLVYRKEDEMKLTSAEEERLLELAEEARELERQPNPASTAALVSKLKF